jgi:hypothetical protein
MKMKLDIVKTAAVVVIILMMASITLTALSIQPAEAQLAANQPYYGPLKPGDTADATVTTIASLSFRPNPDGIGEPVLVNFWTTPGLASNDRYMPQGACVVTITDPDGTKDVRNMRSEPATAANWFEFVPEKVGTWTIKYEFLGAYFPAGQYYNGAVVTNSSGAPYKYGSAYYTPSSTQAQTLTVQTNPILPWPSVPLPTDYWTRPANLNNREWWPILGNYPGTGYQGGGPMWDALYPNTNPSDSPGGMGYNFVPWVQAPNSAHILWTQQTAIAGLIGGPAGIYGTTGSPGTPSVIYSGRCYQTMTIPVNGVPTSCAVCYDLRTGQQYYAIPTASGGVTPSYIAYVSPQANTATVAGEEIFALAWSVELLTISGSYLQKINPNTGALTGNFSISPLSGGIYYNQMGGYVLTVQTLGNTTNPSYRLVNWTTRGTGTLASRIQSNITWPGPNLPNQYNGGSGVNQHGCYMLPTDFNAGIAAWVTRDTQLGSEILWTVNITGYSLSTGQKLWGPVQLPNEGTYSSTAVVADHGKVAFLTQRGYFLAYDLYTGQLAWKSDVMEYPWASASFGAYAIQSAYGMLFRQSYAGVYAFNWTNGKIVWNYKAPAYASFESPYIENGTEQYSFNAGAIIADGKMYTYNTEHTPTWPLTRGWGIHCINITTGEGIWTLNNPMSYGAIADGYLTASNSWDGSMYVFGKGKSATTVTAPDVNVALGTGFTIKGTVMDMSPAQPNTPCVSKDAMETQMEYIHLQMPIDGLWHNKSITGVPVTLTAIDDNGTVYDLGKATTNGYYGTFSKEWAPPNEGKYQIVAYFTGDDSYSSSGAATAVSVGPAPGQITFPEQPTPIDYSMTIVGAAIAIIVAVAIIGLLLFLALRKR